MIRAVFRSLKPFVVALWLLAFILCAGEVGLRLYESRNDSPRTHDSAIREISRRSSFVHHGLQPLQSVTLRNPDSGAEIELRTNGFGLRGEPIAIPKPAGVYRILCLGDETILGAELAEEETFSARLEHYLQARAPLRVEVINAGVPGYCPVLSYLQYQHELSALQPDLTLLGFAMGDIADDHVVRRHVVTDDGSIPIACPHPALAGEEKPIGGREPLLLMTRARQWYMASLAESPTASDGNDIDSPLARYAWLKPDGPDWSIHIEQALAPIVHLDRLTDRHFGRLMVMTCPEPWQVSATACNGEVRRAAGIPEGAHYSDSRPFDRLRAYLDPRGILLCDAAPAFRKAARPDDLFFDRAPRLSAAGHELYAQTVAASILRNVPGIWEKEGEYGQPEMQAGRISPF